MNAFTRNLLTLASGLLGFGICATGLREIDPLRGVPDVKAQVERVHTHPEATTLFFGSSLTRRGVDPTAFDEALAAQGVRGYSLNCGIDGMTLPEVLFMIDRSIEKQPAALRWIILEASQNRLQRDTTEVRKRDVYWRTTELTELLVQKSWSANPPGKDWTLSECARQIRDHASLWFYRIANLGRISEWSAKPELSVPLAGTVRGETFYSDPRGFLGVELDVAANEIDVLATEIARVPARWAAATEDKIAARALQHLVGRLQKAGIQLILIQPPDTFRVPAPYPSLAIPQFNFMDPASFPELYLPDSRYDARHLNKRGAHLFSVMLARTIAEKMAHKSKSAANPPMAELDRDLRDRKSHLE